MSKKGDCFKLRVNFPCHNGKLNKIVQTWIYIWHVKEELIFNLSSWNLHPDIVLEVITPRKVKGTSCVVTMCTLIRFFHYYYFSFFCILYVRLGTVETFNTCMVYEKVYHDLNICVLFSYSDEGNLNSNFEENPYTFMGQFVWLELT